jgi:iron-sulfur cluster assembly protein
LPSPKPSYKLEENPMSSEETSTPGEQPATTPRITVTPEAARYVKERLVKEGRPSASLRVGVRGGGCNGLTYVLDYTDDPPRSRDLVYDFYGTQVLVDSRSLEYIEGSTIFYERTLMFQGLKFKNPLEASTCGCGETFSVKAEALEKKRAGAPPAK